LGFDTEQRGTGRLVCVSVALLALLA
jgi:hypothetical protein